MSTTIEVTSTTRRGTPIQGRSGGTVHVLWEADGDRVIPLCADTQIPDAVALPGAEPDCSDCRAGSHPSAWRG